MAEPTIEATRTAAPAAGTGLRWEWRTFGQRFGEADARFAALTSSGTTDSDETYFLAPGGDNVKVRDALMDVKVLQAVNADGLEQWAPVMKAGFPLSATDAARVFEALAKDGEVQMPIGPTSWSPAFGMCIDRFGTPWMVGANPTE
jgi:hypothetical protein